MAGATSSSFSQGGNSSARVWVPSSRRAGDLLVVVESANQAGTSWTAPAGWTFGGGGQVGGQDLNWWWRVATGGEPRRYWFTHSQSADGGIVMLDLRGLSSTPVTGVSALGGFDNNGAGNVTSVTCGAVSGTGASLLLVGWQQSAGAITWPAGFKTAGTATDGFGHVEAALDAAPGPASSETVSLNPGESAVLTFQVMLS